MSQHHIRRLAGFGWVRKGWMRLHEPRWVSSIYGCLYAIMFSLGILSVFHPPLTLGNAAGDGLVLMMSLGIVIAGIVGVVSVLRGAYWAERYAVALAGVTILFYGSITIWLAIFSGGYRWWPLILVSGSFVALAVRPYWIWRSEYNPAIADTHD